MVRFTIHDPEKTISFVGEASLAQRLVAACAAEPAMLEELLPAVEPYDSGTTARVIQGLLAFDLEMDAESGYRSTREAGDGKVAGNGHAPWPHSATVEVVDERTARLADTPDAEGLLRIDLEGRAIGGRVVTMESIATRGTLDRSIPGRARQKAAFVLSDRWTVGIETVTLGERVAGGAPHD